MGDSAQKKTAQAKTKLKARPVAERPYPKRSGIEAIIDPHSRVTRVPMPQKKVEPLEKTQKSNAKLPLHLQNTVVPDLTSPTKVKSKSPAPAKEQKEDKLKLVIAVAVVFFASWYLMSGDNSRRELSVAEQAEINNRIDFHRAETGRQVNRERINAEIQNESASTDIPWNAKPVEEPNMMEGLPLEPEMRHRTTSRDRIQVTDPDDPEARIQYSIKEQQDLKDWEKRAQKAYIDEFIANAARQGYRVQVDKFGNASVVGRIPSSEQPAGNSRPGSVR